MPFTERQAQILELAARGLSDKEIAQELALSVHTVRTHLQRLYVAENLSNRAEAVAAWVAAQEQAAARNPLASSHVRRVLHLERIRAAWAGAVAGAVVLVAVVGIAAPDVVARLQPAAARTAAACSAGCSPSAPATPAQSPAAGDSTPAAANPTTSPSVSPTRVAAQPSARSTVDVTDATKAIQDINQARAQAGLPPLQWNDCLAGVARTQAARMARQGYVSPADGLAADSACKLEPVPPNELLTYWSSASDTQAEALLMANPTDRVTLLGPYRFAGAAWAVNGAGVAFLAVELD